MGEKSEQAEIKQAPTYTHFELRWAYLMILETAVEDAMAKKSYIALAS